MKLSASTQRVQPSYAGQIASQLQAGQMPEIPDFWSGSISHRDPNQAVSPKQIALELELHNVGRAAKAASSNSREVWRGAIGEAILWGGGAAVLASNAGPIGMAVGAVLGAYVGVDRCLTRHSGSSIVTLDGETTKKSFYLRPSEIEISPAALEAKLKGQGLLGDAVALAEFKLPAETKSSNQTWSVQASQGLKSLGEQRRLLADLGGQSQYGKDSVQLVTALQAKQLLDAGASVYRIDALQSQDQVHNLEIQAQTKARKESHSETYQFTEREVSYRLVSVNSASQFETSTEGQGLPQGINGVYRDENKFTAVIAHQASEGSHAIREHNEDYSTHYGAGTVDPATRAVAAPTTFQTTWYMNLAPLCTLMGACAGGIVGMSFGQAMTGLGMIGGGVAGREVGKVVNHFTQAAADRRLEAVQEKRAARKKEMEALFNH